MKKTLATLAIIAMLTLTGCGQVEQDGKVSGGGLSEVALTLKDGRTITCIRFSGGYAGGLSCDWDDTK